MPDDHTPTPLERASVPLLLALHRVPRWLFLVVVGGLLLAGLLLENALGGAILLLLALFLGWLATIGWHQLTPSGRLLRVGVVGLLVFAAVSRFA